MAFGKNKAATSKEDRVQSEEFEDDFVDLMDEENNQEDGVQNVKQSKSQGTNTLDAKPLNDEVKFIGAGNSKNAGGSKVWVCKHCNGQFTSSYTRIHTHFFGAPIGKKAEIKRCPVLMNDRETYIRLQKKVKDAETAGVSKTLKSSVVTKKHNLSSNKPMEHCLATMERGAVDLKIVKALCANGIPFNVLRNPQFREMINAIKKAPEGYKAPSSDKARTVLLVEQIVLKRWEKMTIPLHCLGFALTPRFYDTRYLETVAPGGTKRRAPNLDVEVVQGVMEAFDRIAENKQEERLLREQFATFHMKKGLYSLPAAQMDAVTMEAVDWWSTYGAETPELAEVAKKVLSQPISSSSAERNWSTYSYIHNVKRNRLNCKRADKLVYVHSNIRLSSRFSEVYKEGPHKKWDMDPESTYMEGSTSRLEWEDLDDEDDDKGKGKKQRVD